MRAGGLLLATQTTRESVVHVRSLRLLMLPVAWLALSSQATAQLVVVSRNHSCETPAQPYEARALYCADAEGKKIGEGLDRFEALLVKPPVRPVWLKLKLNNKVPQRSTMELASCDPYSSAKFNGSTTAGEEERACVARWLQGRLDWARKVDALLRLSPELAAAQREYEACKSSKDSLMVVLCDIDVPSAAAYAKVAASAEKLRGADASDVLRGMTRKHEQWVAEMGRRCAPKAESNASAPRGCWPQDFDLWGEQIEAAIKEEKGRAVAAAEKASAVDLECEVPWRGKKIRRYITYYKSSGRLVLVEPPANMGGPPIERMATQYEGKVAVTMTALVVEFGRPWAFSNDPQTQALINGEGGGVFLNDGRLGRNIVEHNLSFVDKSLTTAEYHYVVRSGPELRAPMTCKPSK